MCREKMGIEEVKKLAQDIIEERIEHECDLIAENPSTSMLLYVVNNYIAIADWDGNEIAILEFEDEKEKEACLEKIAAIARAFEYCMFPLDALVGFYSIKVPVKLEVQGTKVTYVKVPRLPRY